MNVQRKDAAIANVDEDFPGGFEVVLSTPSRDRDGDELHTDEWKQPLPEHITFDVDHGMSVEKTIGSGAPSIDEDGRLVVAGTYSSLPKAQEVRTLVKEGHIRTVSVAFTSSKVTKDGTSRTERELLNGAFVAIPANTEAVVLSAKSGARNSTADQAHLQSAHDHLAAMGAECAPMDDSGAADGATGGKSVTVGTVAISDLVVGVEAEEKRLTRMVAAKAVDGSFEQREQAISDALQSRYPGDDIWAYSIATFEDSVVYRVSGGGDTVRGQWQSSYTYADGVVTLGDPERVDLVEQVVPMKSYITVSAGAESTDSITEGETRHEKSVDEDALLLKNRAIQAQASAYLSD